MTGATGCRTAQESRRSSNSRVSNAATPSLAKEVDSLRMVQEKLIEVIDSLTSLASADRDRIRALESDVSLLRSRIDGTPLSEPMPEVPTNSQPEGSYTAPAQPKTPPAAEDEHSSNALDRYQSALRLYNAKEYSEALAAFSALEKDDPESAYAGNYKYWEGECYYALKDYNRSLRRFQNVIDEHPHSSKAPAAEFKVAECYERLGRPANAKAAFEKLLADYPNSEFRTKAIDHLKMLP